MNALDMLELWASGDPEHRRYRIDASVSGLRRVRLADDRQVTERSAEDVKRATLEAISAWDEEP